ncbi:hypothetical protein [Gallaecimonas xiamenensis]|uniref:Uncharacterized protein n=1 Tax=Gallaecimonas xiamenensis 3-C-1 TaxID=745411 RepID=K2IYX9_9GAMM|nr:hypothetical protein [Gallaecimonas xiamenensis]EKE67742.1 hypothetical protein B3C1_18306 [Gallaecimonas xiamenensis 3-C-1]
MDTNLLHQGTLCLTRNGAGWIMEVDREHHKLRLKNHIDGHEFVADFDDVIDDFHAPAPEDEWY